MELIEIRKPAMKDNWFKVSSWLPIFTRLLDSKRKCIDLDLEVESEQGEKKHVTVRIAQEEVNPLIEKLQWENTKFHKARKPRKNIKNPEYFTVKDTLLKYANRGEWESITIMLVHEVIEKISKKNGWSWNFTMDHVSRTVGIPFTDLWEMSYALYLYLNLEDSKK